MNYNIELLKADILDELDKIQRIKEEFIKIEQKLDQTSESMSYYD